MIEFTKDRLRRRGEPVNVAVVEDDPNDRLLLEHTLRRAENFHAVGFFATGEAALKSPIMAEAAVVLMDIRMPGMSGIDCTRLLKKIFPSLTILIVTGAHESDALREAFLAGANGYLSKPLTDVECCEAMRHALAGGLPVGKEVMLKAISFSGPSARLGTLNARQKWVLQCMSGGLRNKEIADKLGVSVDAVENVARKMYLKLRVSNRAEAVSCLHAENPPSGGFEPPMAGSWNGAEIPTPFS